MQLAILIPKFLPKWSSGMEVMTYSYAQFLRRKGHQVHIITSSDLGRDYDEDMDGITVHRIKRSGISVINPIFFTLKAIGIIKKIKPDIVHSQGFVKGGIVCFLMKKITKIPYVIYVRSSVKEYSASFLFHWVIKKILDSSDILIVLTQEMKEDLERDFTAKPVKVIPNGIDIERFSGFSKSQIRKEFGIAGDQNVLIYVGRLHPIKGVRYLVEAVDILRTSRENFMLYLIGKDQGELKFLMEYIREKQLSQYITFVDQVPSEKIPPYLSMSDIFILPSISEGFPNAMLEAMAAGLPVIVSDVDGLSAIVKNSVNGFLVESKKPEQIAEKILLLMEKPVLRETMGNTNKEYAKAFSKQKIHEEIEETYASLKQ